LSRSPDKKRILVVCGTAIATSTVVAMKVKDFLRKHGIKAEVKQCKASEAKTASKDADLIVATTQVVDVSIPVIDGKPIITGIGIDEVERKIVEALQDA
jgi:PTS system galactitol-specific IIB component